jgi:hypothetical protein
VENRRAELTTLIERTYADAETLAASVVTATAVGGAHETATMRAMIDQITADAKALEAAHREVADLGGNPTRTVSCASARTRDELPLVHRPGVAAACA